MPLPQPDLCQFKRGDLIQHPVFGFGTVSGTPQRLNAGSIADEEEAEGWLIPVHWRDADHPPSVMMDSTLKRVAQSAPQSCGHLEIRWQSLLLAWKTARRGVEEVSSTLRPPPDLALLQKALENEAQAREALEQFREDDRQDKH